METQKLPQSLEKALSRLTANKAHSSGSVAQCAISLPCSACQDHKGIRLENDGVFIKASLCSCVTSCKICAGTCAKPESGGVIDCQKPSPVKIVGLLNDAKIPGRYVDASIKNFSNFTGSGKTVMAQIMRWIEHFVPGKSSGLLLTGSVGVGKTYVISAVAKELALRGISVRFADFYQLVNELRDAYSSDGKSTSPTKPLHDFEVLVIDELGKGRNTEWEVSIADSLISDRYNGNKSIIASTNYGLKEGNTDATQRTIDLWSTGPQNSNQMNAESFENLNKRLGPRIFSRLKEMTVFLELTGADFRRH